MDVLGLYANNDEKGVPKMSRRVIGASGETPPLIAAGDINAHHTAWEEGAKNDDRSVRWFNFFE